MSEQPAEVPLAVKANVLLCELLLLADKVLPPEQCLKLQVCFLYC